MRQYPISVRDRQERRIELKRTAVEHAVEEADRSMRSMKCSGMASGSHAGTKYGCQNDGSSCLCECHDGTNLKEEQPASGFETVSLLCNEGECEECDSSDCECSCHELPEGCYVGKDGELRDGTDRSGEFLGVMPTVDATNVKRAVPEKTLREKLETLGNDSPLRLTPSQVRAVERILGEHFDSKRDEIDKWIDGKVGIYSVDGLGSILFDS